MDTPLFGFAGVPYRHIIIAANHGRRFRHWLDFAEDLPLCSSGAEETATNRHLSLIALMLFAAAPLSAQVPQGWIAAMKTGCRVWNTFPQPGETISWTGLCQNELAEGRGVLQWFKDGSPMAR